MANIWKIYKKIGRGRCHDPKIMPDLPKIKNNYFAWSNINIDPQIPEI